MGRTGNEEKDGQKFRELHPLLLHQEMLEIGKSNLPWNRII